MSLRSDIKPVWKKGYCQYLNSIPLTILRINESFDPDYWNIKIKLTERDQYLLIIAIRERGPHKEARRPIVSCGIKPRFLQDQLQLIEDMDELEYMESLVASQRYSFTDLYHSMIRGDEFKSSKINHDFGSRYQQSMDWHGTSSHSHRSRSRYLTLQSNVN